MFKFCIVLLSLSIVSFQSLADEDFRNDEGYENIFSPSLEGWDVNIGTVLPLTLVNDTQIEPFVGVSYGKVGNSDSETGLNLGVVSRDSHLSFGFSTTSKSVQLGYKSYLLSINEQNIGFGIRFNFGEDSASAIPSFYASGNVLLELTKTRPRTH